ncbi:Translation machinery-associated protein 20, partial [Fasciolopsis buskii]
IQFSERICSLVLSGFTLQFFSYFFFCIFTTDPFMLPHLQVDRGAIKHVLNGSNIMCPGLTSPGARMTQVPQGSVVAVMAEGKDHALAVGITSLSTDEILRINKGVGVENVHYLNDGLWRLKPVR